MSDIEYEEMTDVSNERAIHWQRAIQNLIMGLSIWELQVSCRTKMSLSSSLTILPKKKVTKRKT